MTTECVQTFVSIAILVSALSTLALVIVGIFQLRQINCGLEENQDREKRQRTLNACDRYVFDPIIHSYTNSIWLNSNNGKDYTHITEPDYNIIAFMNYLEGIAIGVSQGVYIKEIIRDYLWGDIYKAVKAIIRGESGEVEGFSWKAINSLFTEKSYPNLLKLYSEFFESE